MTVLDEIEAAIPALRRYAHALVRDREGADDLVQDCLERAVARRRDWRGEGTVRAWLFRILLNLNRDTRRAAAARAVLVSIQPQDEPHGSAGRKSTWTLPTCMPPWTGCLRTSARRCCWLRWKA